MNRVSELKITRERPGSSWIHNEPSWLAALRVKSTARFLKMDWPSRTEEHWHRTDLSGIDLDKYVSAPVSRDVPVGDDSPSGKFSAIITFKGGFCTDMEMEERLELAGAVVLPLRTALKRGEAGILPTELYTALKKDFLKGAAVGSRFNAWHYSRTIHGAVIYVPPSVNTVKPVYIRFTESGNGVPRFPHLFIMLGKGARAGIFHNLTSRDEDELLCDSASSILLRENARLDYTCLQTLGLRSSVFQFDTVSLGPRAHLNRFDAQLGGRLCKTGLDIRLHGRGGESNCDGVFLSANGEQKDIGLVQRHTAPETVSRAFFRAGVTGTGRSVFQGLIDIRPGAYRTDAYLSNRNLVLGPDARADSIPSLRIGTNDVKCGHASATGKLDPNQKFYLMSRGFPEKTAEAMLARAFFDDVLLRAPNFSRDALQEAFTLRLHDDAGGEEAE